MRSSMGRLTKTTSTPLQVLSITITVFLGCRTVTTEIERLYLA
jgi:predicted membrane chloride channel (bestrophin family)